MKLEPIYWTDLGVTGGGPFYRAADVDALLASIRAAVAAERVCADKLMDYPPVPWGHTGTARAALDALLSGEG